MKHDDLIFGLTWNQIQDAQQKRPYRERVDLSRSGNPTATPEDIARLHTDGLAKLHADGMYGIIDRLKTSGMIE
jgi:hypothetical protein